MNKVIRAFLGLAFASLFTPLVSAQGSNPVVSDGVHNTAMGTGALSSSFNIPSAGTLNTAAGYQALLSNSTGTYNSAFGYKSLQQNTSGSYNSAFGSLSLNANTTGGANTALGWKAAALNTTGNDNVAIGGDALLSNATGSSNTAVGMNALQNATGSYNIAIGQSAGISTTTGNYNIEIGATGGSTDSNVIRIGTVGQQNAAYIQGIYGVEVGSNYGDVVIDNIGHLGTYGSAERFKTDVQSMVLDERKLQRLRPVTFHLRNDPAGPLHYGLIAEEVDRINPNLVFRSEHGRIDGVHYEELTPILLKEVQQQSGEFAAQGAKLGRLERQLAQLQARLAESQKSRPIAARHPSEEQP
jgi:hypothetical protein